MNRRGRFFIQSVGWNTTVLAWLDGREELLVASLADLMRHTPAPPLPIWKLALEARRAETTSPAP